MHNTTILHSVRVGDYDMFVRFHMDNMFYNIGLTGISNLKKRNASHRIGMPYSLVETGRRSEKINLPFISTNETGAGIIA